MMAFLSVTLLHSIGRRFEILQTELSRPPQNIIQVKSSLGPSVATVTLIIAVEIVKRVREKIPAKASFLRIPICTFQRMLVETRITNFRLARMNATPVRECVLSPSVTTSSVVVTRAET